jgi:hypothetical protein
MELKRANINDNKELHAFLKRGRMAMGIEYAPRRERKQITTF